MTVQLPIDAHKAEIIAAIKANQVVIVEGETGSGKTTHIPLYLFECEEIMERGMVGVTEPRRVAATSVAKYVSELLGCRLGEEVAYQIRFDTTVSDETKIKFMTDGILLREVQLDKQLSQYSAIVVDEAHERSLNIDLTLGFLKEIIKTRPDLKIIITSATIDTAKFSSFFDGAPVISIPGRCYPVEIIYRPATEENFRFGTEYAKEAAQVVREMHEGWEAGDILVFMSGMDDITACAKELEEMGVSDLMVLIAHGEMTTEDQSKIFQNFKLDGTPLAHDENPADFELMRKVVIGTNIIESSITVDGAKYCVDAGYIKQTGFDPSAGLASLKREKHSRAGCDQRTGRVGRTQPGICVRLYSEHDYLSRPSYTIPEILRTELAGLVLHMKSVGIHNIENFEFVDNPGREAIHAAHQTLIKLGAILPNNGLTETGRLMAKLPVEPRSGRMIIEAAKLGCVDQVLTVVAFRSLHSVFARPREKQREADLAKARYKNSTSDYLTWLRVFGDYMANGQDWGWAHARFLKGKVLSEVIEIRKQLIRILAGAGIELTSSDNHEEIAKCVTAGLVENVCKKIGFRGHEYVSNERYLFVFPGSALMMTDPAWFVCNEIRDNGSRTFGIDCQVIKPEWLFEVAPQLCQSEIVGETIELRGDGTFVADCTVTFEGQQEAFCLQQVRFGPEDPRYGELTVLYAAEKIWRQFVAENPEIEAHPRGLANFDLGEPRVVKNGAGADIIAYPYIRIEGVLEGKRYFTGYTRDRLKAVADTSHALTMWKIGNSRHSTNGYRNYSPPPRNYGYGGRF